MMGADSQNQVVALPGSCEIGLGVVDNLVCAKVSHLVYIPGAANRSHFSPECFGNLNGKCANAARCAFDKNLMAWPNSSLVTKSLERRARRDGYCRCLLKRQA